MFLSRIASAFRGQHWTTLLMELVVLIVGVFVGLQVDAWNSWRLDRSEEREYLVRLLDDSQRNLASLQARRDGLERLRESIARSIEILDGDVVTEADYPSVQLAMCRWYIEPAVAIARGTYSELVSSGRLGLLRNTELREALEATDTRHEQAVRQMDLFGGKAMDLSAELEPARVWHPIDGRGEHRCDIDWDLLRSTPRARSVMAQLYYVIVFYRNARDDQTAVEQSLQEALLCELERGACPAPA